jgi:alcohol dehydrogenase
MPRLLEWRREISASSSVFSALPSMAVFASHVLVPDARYLLDYDPLPVNQAATLMCSGVTAYGALKRLVDRPRQRNLLLIGLGGVGMMGLAFAQAMFKQKISGSGVEIPPRARRR